MGSAYSPGESNSFTYIILSQFTYTVFPRFSAGSKWLLSRWALKQMSLKKAPGSNECRVTEDFEINERWGTHSGKYGTCSGIICGRVFKGVLYTHGIQILICLHLYRTVLQRFLVIHPNKCRFLTRFSQGETWLLEWGCQWSGGRAASNISFFTITWVSFDQSTSNFAGGWIISRHRWGLFLGSIGL